MDGTTPQHLASILAQRGARAMTYCFANGGCQANLEHFCTELVTGFGKFRHSIRAFCPVSNSSLLSAAANDSSWQEAYAKIGRALARPEDTLILASSSGSSDNLTKLAHEFQDDATLVVSLSPTASPLSLLANINLATDAPTTQAIQELQLTLLHELAQGIMERLR